MKVFVIDLFAGAGGTSTAIFESKTNISVVACINHDANAIRSHAENYPDCIHFTEDIRTVALKPLADYCDKLRTENPGCKIAIWASLECTNHSRAKGGISRDADSRTLAEHLFRYDDEIKPDFFWIENVREFMIWGPIDANGRPIQEYKGCDYEAWVAEFKRRGYSYDCALLNAADYGAYTSRIRYFGQFSKDTSLISWPEPTHSKSLAGELPKWKPVREVLELQDEGKSIFDRKKQLAEATLERIYAGLVKFVAKGDEGFIKKYFSGNPEGKVISLTDPCGTITTVDHHAVVKCDFLCSYYGNSTFIQPSEPCGTLTTKDRFSKVNVSFIDNQYGNSKPTSSEQPIGTLTANPKQNVVSVKKNQYLLNPQYASKGSDINNPCFTLIARMDKAPPYLISPDDKGPAIEIQKHDTEGMVKVKKFMHAYGISDIKMRMLKIPEMLRIQGFPDGYKLIGTQTEQKKFIGNSVEVNVGKALFRAIDQKIQQSTLK